MADRRQDVEPGALDCAQPLGRVPLPVEGVEQRELGVPVKLVGLGEGPDDLAPFEPTAFVDALLR